VAFTYLCHQAILSNKLLVVAVTPLPAENGHPGWYNFNYQQCQQQC